METFALGMQWDPDRRRILVAACSDGRLQEATDRFLARALGVAVTPGQAALAHQRKLRPTRVVVVRPAQGGACP